LPPEADETCMWMCAGRAFRRSQSGPGLGVWAWRAPCRPKARRRRRRRVRIEVKIKEGVGVAHPPFGVRVVGKVKRLGCGWRAVGVPHSCAESAHEWATRAALALWTNSRSFAVLRMTSLGAVEDKCWGWAAKFVQ